MLLGRITRNIDNSSKQKSFVSYHITQPIEFIIVLKILVNKEFQKKTRLGDCQQYETTTIMSSNS